IWGCHRFEAAPRGAGMRAGLAMTTFRRARRTTDLTAVDRPADRRTDRSAVSTRPLRVISTPMRRICSIAASTSPWRRFTPPQAVEVHHVPGGLAAMVGGEAAVIARMPVLRGDNDVEAAPADQLVGDGNDGIAFRHGERAAGDEIILQIDQDEGVPGAHRFPP